MVFYYGSNVVVKIPEIITNGYYKDFGYGFYCTNIERQARRWAYTKRKTHIVNQYEYTEIDNLKRCTFAKMTEEWLEFVVNCRRGIHHNYDIVDGPMTDDTIWDYIEDYVSGKISKAAFWELVKFKYPTHQIVFSTENALQSLKYKGSYSL